jgi:alpha-L-rhamnosidase
MKATVEFLAASRIDGLVPSAVGDWHDAVKPDLNIDLRRERGLERDDTWGAIMGGYPVHTPARACGTVHLWLAAEALYRAAGVLGEPADEARFRKLAAELREAFNRAYLDPETGRYRYLTPKGKTYESQTIYGYALYHGLVPDEKRALAASRFLEHIEACGGHFTSGQLGTDRVVKALAATGNGRAAFRLMTAKGYPGFDLMLSFGTETTWETWGESILNNTPEGSAHIIRAIRPQEHCQWTGVDSFFFEFVLGIRPDPAAPGYKHFFVEPHLFREMAWAEGSQESARGTITSAWRCDGKEFDWAVAVPPNASATLSIPCGEDEPEIEAGAPGVRSVGPPAGGRRTIEVGSGRYRFKAKLP